MSFIVKVERYDSTGDYHGCVDVSGNRLRIDLITSGCLDRDISPLSLVGKSIKIERTHCFLAMAEGVKIIEQEEG